MKNKGITLISLIVTVIIMIILASVTVNLITDGGIITKTRTATSDYQKQLDKEQLDLLIASETDYITGTVNLEELENALTEAEWTNVSVEDNILTATSPNGIEFTQELEVADEEDDGNIYINNAVYTYNVESDMGDLKERRYNVFGI